MATATSLTESAFDERMKPLVQMLKAAETSDTDITDIKEEIKRARKELLPKSTSVSPGTSPTFGK
jgi:hypothetical protein